MQTQKFKQTGIGMIPEDWDVKKLGEIADIKKGQLITDSTRIEGIIPVIAGGKTPAYYHNKANRHGKTITISGSGANAGYVAFHIRPIFASDCSTIEESKSYSIEFVYFILESLQEKIYKMQAGGAQPHIHPNDLDPIIVPIPKHEEQYLIASVLSDTDALIEYLDKLIVKKKNIKHGAMQELLTGKRRLPGFKGGWEVKKLKELIEIPVTDGPHLTPKFLQEGIPFLSVNNLTNNRIDLSDLRFISREDHEIFSKKCKPKKEDILLGKAASVGLVAVVNLDIEFNIWSPIALIRLNKQNVPKFIYYFMQNSLIINQIKILTNSSSQGNIGMGDIETLQFLVPNKEEQSAIAEILSDMDSEIEHLERKRDKYKGIKIGMMQELLTGRIRLK